MSDETGATSEVARVLREHSHYATDASERGDLAGANWECADCAHALGVSFDDDPTSAMAAHQAAMLAEAGLLRYEKPARDPECSCAACDRGLLLPGDSPLWFPSRMNVCPDCGNKRCPKAADHAKWQCSGSNDVGQVGVRIEDAP